VRRGFWFAAGAATGVYALTKARRTAEAFTPEGLRDRLAGVSLGARLFREEVRTEVEERENELRTRLKLGTPEPARALASTDADTTAEPTRSN